MRQAQRWFVGAACLALGACAAAPAHRAGPDGNGGKWYADMDDGKVVAVTQWARMKGATVVWVHYPTRNQHDDGG